MSSPLSETTIALVKASIPALEAHGVEITRRMYERMFENPAIKAMFNQSHQQGEASQAKAVAQAVLAYAKNIDNLATLGDVVEHVAQKHTALLIEPKHYPHVGAALLGAIGDVLGADATPEIMAAWGEAYSALAGIFIGRETTIYAENAKSPGGWNGWREFEIVIVQPESTIITSFTLAPVEGGVVKRHLPGQYLGLLFDIAGHGDVRRNYSISSAPNGKTYRITVKRESGDPAGLVSNWLHDHGKLGTRLLLTVPAGDFVLNLNTQRPVVLLSGGVGLTPMISMLETITKERPTLPTWFVHGTLNSSVHAMGSHVRALAQGQPVKIAVFYAEPEPTDRIGETHDHSGLIDRNWLLKNTPVADATYYICGPKPFMRTMMRDLHSAGVTPDRMLYEFFGPADETLN